MSSTVSVDEYLAKRKGFVRGDGSVLKAFRAPPSFNADKRSARFVMSTEEPDRDKDVIVQAGLDTSVFATNPQALFCHNARDFPIGRWENITKVNGKPKRTEGDLIFLPAGVDECADRCVAHVSVGSLRAVSIGFFPKTIRVREQEPGGVWPGYEILESELVECSLVTIPANPGALVKDATQMDVRAARLVVEEALDTWAKDPVTGLLVPAAEFEKAYVIVKRSAWEDLLPKTLTSSTPLADDAAKTADDDGDDKGCKPKDDDGDDMEDPEGCGADAKPKGLAATDADRITLKVGVDLSEVETEVKKAEGLLSGLAAKFKSLFGKEAPAPTLPSEEEIASVKTEAEATLTRLKEKGLI